MKLTEAIQALKSLAKSNRQYKINKHECEQIAIWLEELRESRKVIKTLRTMVDQHKILTSPLWDFLAQEGIIA